MENDLVKLLVLPKKKLSVYNEYKIYLEQSYTHFGRQTILFYQNGSFYEIYSKNRNELMHYHRLSGLQIGEKNDHFMIGIPVSTKNKYIQMFLNHNYTVVLVDQETQSEQDLGNKFKRIPVMAYSPGVPNIELGQTLQDSNDILFIYFDINGVSISTVDLQTGITNIASKSTKDVSEMIDFIYSFVTRYNNIEEASIYIHPQLQDIPKVSKNSLKIELDLLDVSLIHWTVNNIKLTEQFFEQVFFQVYPDIKTSNYLAYFHLNTLEASCLMFEYLFVNKRNKYYLKSLKEPNIITEWNTLNLYGNSSIQLGLFKSKLQNTTSDQYSSVYDLFKNFLKTSLGKRELKRIINNPFRNPNDILYRHTLTEEINQIPQNIRKNIETHLLNIYDIVRLFRRISMNVASPIDLEQLVSSWNTMSTIIQQFTSEQHNLFNINPWHTHLNQTLNKCNSELKFVENNIFKIGVFPELDSLISQINDCETQWNTLAKKYSSIIDSKATDYVKVLYSQTDGYQLITTTLRAQILEKNIPQNESLKFIYKTKSNCRIKSTTITQLSDTHCSLKETFEKKYKQYFQQFVQEIHQLVKNWHHKMVSSIELIDITLCNWNVSQTFKYTCPIIKNTYNTTSFVIADQLRHPVGERISTTKYKSNNIYLGGQNNIGMLLYGINASGKSMLLKSIGIAIVLAQSGLYVPCKTFTFYPYSTIISQVDLHDNFYKSQSSFMIEVNGIRNILKNSNRNTLVLADELCKGTESISGAALLGSLICTLIEKKSSFIFTTHLHKLGSLETFTHNPSLRICHLTVSQNPTTGEICFDRTLQNGPCETLYGLKVAEYLHLPEQFLTIANQIKDDIQKTNNHGLVTTFKKSRYNSKKIIIQCEICNYKPIKKTDIPLDIHHIDSQCNADHQGYIENYHKNSLFNLICLCKQCHQKVHQGTLSIHKNTLL